MNIHGAVVSAVPFLDLYDDDDCGGGGDDGGGDDDDDDDDLYCAAATSDGQSLLCHLWSSDSVPPVYSVVYSV